MLNVQNFTVVSKNLGTAQDTFDVHTIPDSTLSDLGRK